MTLPLVPDAAPRWEGCAVDIREHGAASSTTADNRARILEAVDRANAARVPVVFPPGDWGISQPLPFRASMIGHAPGARLFALPGFSGGQLVDFAGNNRICVSGVHKGKQYSHYVTPAAPSTFTPLPGP